MSMWINLYFKNIYINTVKSYSKSDFYLSPSLIFYLSLDSWNKFLDYSNSFSQ